MTYVKRAVNLEFHKWGQTIKKDRDAQARVNTDFNGKIASTNQRVTNLSQALKTGLTKADENLKKEAETITKLIESKATDTEKRYMTDLQNRMDQVKSTTDGIYEALNTIRVTSQSSDDEMRRSIKAVSNALFAHRLLTQEELWKLSSRIDGKANHASIGGSDMRYVLDVLQKLEDEVTKIRLSGHPSQQPELSFAHVTKELTDKMSGHNFTTDNEQTTGEARQVTFPRGSAEYNATVNTEVALRWVGVPTPTTKAVMKEVITRLQRHGMPSNKYLQEVRDGKHMITTTGKVAVGQSMVQLFGLLTLHLTAGGFLVVVRQRLNCLVNNMKTL